MDSSAAELVAAFEVLSIETSTGTQLAMHVSTISIKYVQPENI